MAVDVQESINRFQERRQTDSLSTIKRSPVGVVQPAKIRNLIEFKAVPLNLATIDFKAGLYNSRSRINRLIQAAGSSALPGDSSRLRHPIRSALARAIAPGSPGKLGRTVGNVGPFRCPAGFENGGKFTGRDLQNCGRRLFVPASGLNADNPLKPNTALGRAIAKLPGVDGPEDIPDATPGKGKRVRETGFNGRALAVARNAQIPTVGKRDNGKIDKSVRKAASLIEKDNDRSFLVRRDGVALEAVIGLSDLKKINDNPDMEDGVLVSSALKTIGTEEIPALINSPLSAVVFVLPGGRTMRVSASSKLTAAKRRKLNAAFAKVSGPEGLQKFVDESGGAVTMEFNNWKIALEPIRIRPKKGGPSRQVPRWIFETYLSQNAPGRAGRDPWVPFKG